MDQAPAADAALEAVEEVGQADEALAVGRV
jgi:hypothetical protein